MNDNPPVCLVILAGGQSLRMGQDKATIRLDGARLIDRAIARYQSSADRIWLSAASDFGTGIDIISDDPDMPGGPVGAIFTIAAHLPILCPEAVGFVTIPVDAPFAPDDLIPRLSAVPGCSVAQSPRQLHPVFGYWRCDIIRDVSETYRNNKQTESLHQPAPSLQWLVRQCNSQLVSWPDEQAFMNINTPEDLALAEATIIKAQI